MNKFRPGIQRGINRYTFSVLAFVLLAILARTLIPAGYMPDLTALKQGRLEITFCTTGSGALPASFLETLQHNDTERDTILTHEECPFGIFSQQDHTPPTLPANTIPPLMVVAVMTWAFDNAALPNSGPRGPPLGSRAPPYFLS